MLLEINFTSFDSPTCQTFLVPSLVVMVFSERSHAGEEQWQESSHYTSLFLLLYLYLALWTYCNPAFLHMAWALIAHAHYSVTFDLQSRVPTC